MLSRKKLQLLFLGFGVLFVGFFLGRLVPIQKKGFLNSDLYSLRDRYVLNVYYHENNLLKEFFVLDKTKSDDDRTANLVISMGYFPSGILAQDIRRVGDLETIRTYNEEGKLFKKVMYNYGAKTVKKEYYSEDNQITKTEEEPWSTEPGNYEAIWNEFNEKMKMNGNDTNVPFK